MTAFPDLEGKTLKSVSALDSDVIIFTFEDAPDWRMYHDQDCCERVRPTNFSDTLFLPIIGKKLLTVTAEVAQRSDEYDYGSITDTTYIFTGEGAIEVRLLWIGTSNGYYSERVDFRPTSQYQDWRS